MRQAFQMAGAEAVVATLWPIPDQETSELMGTFYDALADGKSRAQSLREAQLEFARNKRAESWGVHPFYWAAFTLTGHYD